MLEKSKAGAKELTELETCAQEPSNLHKGPQLGSGLVSELPKFYIFSYCLGFLTIASKWQLSVKTNQPSAFLISSPCS